ncbi:MAG: polysaccharide deacetylase family protein, partial [Pseudomonadota bacterium]
KVLAITIDDAFESVYTVAWPMLRQAGLPFTLFVATEAIDKNYAGYMRWDQIIELAEAGVTIGSQAVTHPHLTRLSTDSVARELRDSRTRLEMKINRPVTLLAYPYGEASLSVMNEATLAGYNFAFGQHSGALGDKSDRWYLPRFAMNMRYGTLERFRERIAMKSLPVTKITPSDPLIDRQSMPTHITLELDASRSAPSLGQIQCYHSPSTLMEQVDRPIADGQGTTGDRSGTVLVFQLPRPLDPGRNRINCTARDADGSWRWFGWQFIVQ